MKRHFLLIPFFAAIGLVNSCVVAPPPSSGQQVVNTRSIAEEKLGGTAQCFSNSREDMDVCVLKDKQVTPPSVSFVVVSRKDGNVIMDVMTVRGSVEWYNDTQLRIQDHPGYIPKDDDPTRTFYLYDVLERKRIEGNI